MKTAHKILFTALLASGAVLYSCNNDGDTPPPNIDGIPNDIYASANPEVKEDEITSKIPNVYFSEAGKKNIINMLLTGIQDVETEGWLRLYGTNEAKQNVWVEVDGKPKGILVENVSATRAPLPIMIDLVFLVDNSASMGEESDAVANGLTAWATELASKGLDIMFGCVGYDAYGLNGGIDLSELADMDDFLNREGRSGRNRTYGYVVAETGTRAELNWLEEAAQEEGFHNTTNAECGVRALRFADQNFGFRFGANRIYVNLTDEPNQPLGDPEYSVEYASTQEKWPTNNGTIHTVYSAVSTFEEIQYQKEHPWRLSGYTNGTQMLDVAGDFSGVTLNDLPITGAMGNSHRIKFVNNSEITNGTHDVKVTVVSGDTKAVKEFTNVTFATE